MAKFETTIGERGKMRRAYAKVPTRKQWMEDIKNLRRIGPIPQFRSSDIARWKRGDLTSEELAARIKSK
jgi:hypothetical protein